MLKINNLRRGLVLNVQIYNNNKTGKKPDNTMKHYKSIIKKCFFCISNKMPKKLKKINEGQPTMMLAIV